LLIHQRIVDGRSAKIHTSYDWHAVAPLLFEDCSAQTSRILASFPGKRRFRNISRADGTIY